MVVVATAHGLKYSGTTVAYHEGRIEGVSSRRANRPVSLPATFDAVVSLLDNDRVRH